MLMQSLKERVLTWFMCRRDDPAAHYNLSHTNTLNALDRRAFAVEACADRQRVLLYKSVVDSDQDMSDLDRDREHRDKASALERQYVHNVYTQQAQQLATCRSVVWPKVRQFLCDLPPGSVVADVGSGQGKYKNVNREISVLCCDVVLEMLLADNSSTKQSAKQTITHAVVADNLNLPFRENSLDGVLSVSVIHHFATHRRRRAAVAELARVLKPGGRMLVCVWAYEQSSRQFSAQDVLVPMYMQMTTQTQDPQFDPANRDACSSADKPRRPVEPFTREQRIIRDSVGICPIDAQPEQNSYFASASETFTKHLGKIWPNSDQNAQKRRSTLASWQPTKVTPRTVANQHRGSLLQTDIVNTLAYYSPTLGRKLASLVGQSEEKQGYEQMAEQLFIQAYEAALREFFTDGDLDLWQDETSNEYSENKIQGQAKAKKPFCLGNDSENTQTIDLGLLSACLHLRLTHSRM